MQKPSFLRLVQGLILCLILPLQAQRNKTLSLTAPNFMQEAYLSPDQDPNNWSGEVRFSILSEQAEKRKPEQWISELKLEIPAKTFHDGTTTKALRKTNLSLQLEEENRTFQHKKETYYLAHIIEQNDEMLLFYGNQPNEFHTITDISLLRIYQKRNGQFSYTLDFADFGKTPHFIYRERDFVFQDLLWARLENKTLYVQNAHWTYAESSKKSNGYLSALDLSNKGKVLWRSQSLVGNAANFLDFDRFFVTAYGFTREGGYLYAIDKKTGRTLGKIELFAPSNAAQKHITLLAAKGKTIYLKLGDGTEYEVQVQY